MILGKDIEDLVINNVLGKVGNGYLIDRIKSNLSNIPIINDEYDELNRKRLLRTTSDDYGAGIIAVDSILGNYINLYKLEILRKLQIETNSEKLVVCKKVEAAHEWLSGGLSVNFFSNEDEKHIIYLNYPIRSLKIRIYDISGALYIDNRLVPVRSNLEYEIMNMLKTSHCEDDLDGVVDKIIHFVESNSYIENAREIGRIK